MDILPVEVLKLRLIAAVFQSQIADQKDLKKRQGQQCDGLWVIFGNWRKNMAEPRASKHESLWHPCVWVCGMDGIYTIGDRLIANDSVYIVDQAILKMMEKGDE